MDFEKYKQAPPFICPKCSTNIEDGRWRLQCLINPVGLRCPACDQVTVRLNDNYWFALLGACALLFIGGRLWTAEFPPLFCLLFFICGVGVLCWGLYNSALIDKEAGDQVKKKEG